MKVQAFFINKISFVFIKKIIHYSFCCWHQRGRRGSHIAIVLPFGLG